MNILEKRLTMVAMILSLIGVQSSYAQKNVSADVGTTPVTHEEADDATMHFKQKSMNRIKELADRLKTHIDTRLAQSKLPEDRKARIRNDLKLIRSSLQDIWKSIGRTNDVEKAQTIDEKIDAQKKRVDQISEDLKAK